MTVIWTLIIGLLAGWIARLLVPGKNPMGLIVTCLLGVAGSFLARWVGVAMGYYQPGARAGFIASTLGAIVLLVIYHLIKRGADSFKQHQGPTPP